VRPEGDEGPAPGAPAEGELLAIARLGRPHALAGEVRAEPLTPPPVDFGVLVMERPLWLRAGAAAPQQVRIRSLRALPGAYLVALRGFEDRAAAERLRNAELCVARADLPPLPEGWLWEAEVEGLEVLDRRRGLVGRAEGLLEIAGRWSLRVVRAEGEPLLIPWAEALVTQVDLAGRRIDVDLPDDYPGLE
jgi:16S rRNA processing protein RimM